LINDIDLEFFIKGHSKHSNDTGFGIISNHFKRIDAFESYYDVCEEIKNSS